MKKSGTDSFCGSVFLFISLSLIMVFIFPVASRGQDRLSIQLRPGISFATTKLGDADLRTGYGFEGALTYRLIPGIAAYGGWGWNTFSAAASFAGADMDFEETGYAIGLELFHPFAEKFIFDYFLKAGLIIRHIEVQSPAAEIISDSGHGAGFQVEAGLSFPAGDRWKIIPAVKYESLTRDIPLGGRDYTVDLNYLSAGINVCWTF